MPKRDYIDERSEEGPVRRGGDTETVLESALRGFIDGRAPVSAREVRLAVEQFQQLEFALTQRLESILRPKPARPPFSELVATWVEKIQTTRAWPRSDGWTATQLAPLALYTEETLTVLVVRGMLEGMRGRLAPKSINKIRSTGKLVVQLAQEGGLWVAPNPFALTKQEFEPRRKYELLSLDECKLVQPQLRPDRRAMFRLSLHLGLRPGELLALRVEDIDFDAAAIHVRRSHGRNTTKTGESRVVPLLAAIAGDVVTLVRKAKGDGLLFPNADGELQRSDVKITRTLRTAMGNADVGVIEVRYACHRSGCGYSVIEPSSRADTQRDCPQCSWALQPVASVRPVRWYDLRHCCATLHREAGADPLAISTLLGHRHLGLNTTERVYTHLTLEDLHRELSRWHLPV